MRRGSVLSGLTGLFLFALSAARAQSPAKLEFEVASVKPAQIAQALKSGYTAALLPAQEPPVFRSGTRLVEVEVEAL